ILRRARGVFVPASVVVHKTRVLGSTDVDPGERFFFEVRNKLWLLLRSRGLSVWEKLLYGGSSLRRWAVTIARSRERGVLWRGLRRGLAAGVGRKPRPNTVVLAGLGRPSAEVAAVEAARGSRGG